MQVREMRIVEAIDDAEYRIPLDYSSVRKHKQLKWGESQKQVEAQLAREKEEAEAKLKAEEER